MNLPDGFLLQDDKYRITSTIGQGGFGITYLAVWNTEVKGGLGTMKTEVPVCIKEYFFKDYCYREDNSFDVKIHSKTGAELFDKFKEKLIREANILSAVHHPHIVNVLEVFEENNTAYIVMEYIAGCSLKYMLDHESVLPENKVLKYIHQIGNALAFVHEKNIVHLDIKPSNIIIDKDDEARLIDFGVSKRYDITERDTTTTTLTLSKGFASIEQYDDEGTQRFSPCPDVYSLGATMYNLLTGLIPVESILRAAKELLPPTAYNSNISEKTEKSILKSMELKPADRFQSMKEMLATLDIPPYELSENLLIEANNPFADNNSDKMKSMPPDPDKKSNEDDEDRTVVAFVPPSESTEEIRRRRKRKKNNRRKIFSVVAIFFCAIVGYAMYNYFTGDESAKGVSGSQNVDTLQTFDNIASTDTLKINKLDDSKQVNNKPDEKDGKENNPSAVKSETSFDNNRNTTTPEKNGTDSAQQDSVRKEKEYNDFLASAYDNFNKKEYKEADIDIRKALEVQYTNEAYDLSNKIQAKIDETSTEERLAKYVTFTIFGNLTVVRNKDNNLYGAINNRNGEEVIECKYKRATDYPNGKAFIREDNLYDIYDNDGNRLHEGVQFPD
ncbi:MAG: protein kinase [Tannerella sp.]|jgi:serine/threonine-protein kinase|nr:protein kinase [Tannerella sp.]